MLTFDGVTLAQGAFSLTADLSVAPGLTAVIGPSGGGKSTWLASIAGFLEPVRGRVLWHEDDLSRRAPGDRPVAMLFQDNNLFPHLTVRQNVGLALGPRLKLRTEEIGRVEDALSRVGLEGLGGRKPSALSGGQQGRAALARVLLSDRPIVLLDEAFAALGPALRTEMQTLVRDTLVKAARTVLMVTHDPRDALEHAGQVILVADGAVHPPRDTAALFADPPDALRSYLG